MEKEKEDNMVGNHVTINRVDYGVVISHNEDDEKITLSLEKNNTQIVIKKMK